MTLRALLKHAHPQKTPPTSELHTLGTILLIILVLLLLGALPSWPYSATWGPAPAGILGVVLVVVLILVLLGRV